MTSTPDPRVPSVADLRLVLDDDPPGAGDVAPVEAAVLRELGGRLEPGRRFAVRRLEVDMGPPLLT